MPPHLSHRPEFWKWHSSLGSLEIPPPIEGHTLSVLGRGRLISLADFAGMRRQPAQLPPWPASPVLASGCCFAGSITPTELCPQASVDPVTSAIRQQLPFLSTGDVCILLQPAREAFGTPHCCPLPERLLGFPTAVPWGPRTGLSCIQRSHLVTQTTISSFLPKHLLSLPPK